ncbi:MAG: ribose 5-phosphate isomerase B [Elusimicrobiota bacterium]|jgi:ribose 5-phosphate isomerase B
MGRMKIALGSDHAGFELKQALVRRLQETGHSILDLGTDGPQPPVDYPDYARKVAEAVRAGKAERGIVVCGSGVGACVAANKVPGIRAGLCHDAYSARQGVEHDDVNVLCLGSRVVGSHLAMAIADVWIAARFTREDRHMRRLQKVLDIEKAYSKQ